MTRYDEIAVDSLQPFGGDAYVAMIRRQGQIYSVPWQHNNVNDATGLEAVLLRTRVFVPGETATLEVVEVIDALPWLDGRNGKLRPGMLVFEAGGGKLRDINGFWRKARTAAPCAEASGSYWSTGGRFLQGCGKAIRVYRDDTSVCSTFDLDSVFFAAGISWPSSNRAGGVWPAINVWSSGNPNNLYVSKAIGAEESTGFRKPEIDTWPEMGRGDLLKIERREDGNSHVRRIQLDLAPRQFIRAVVEHQGLWVAAIAQGANEKVRIFHVESGNRYELVLSVSVRDSFVPQRDGFIWFSVPQRDIAPVRGRGPTLAMHYVNFKTGARYQYDFDIDPRFAYSSGQILTSTGLSK